MAEASNGDLITGFGVGGAQVIDFGDGAMLEPNDKGWLGALARFDQNGNVKTLKYVTDALLDETSSITTQNNLRLFHLTLDQNDQPILLGEIGGNHTFKNGAKIASTLGLSGNSKDVAIIVCDPGFNPLEAYANTGGNNEAGYKCVSKGNTLYFSGVYDSYSHPFFGDYQPQFGEFEFRSAGNLDIYVASLSLPTSPASVPGLDVTKQAGAYKLSWPTTYSDAVVEFSSNLSPSSWNTLDLIPSLENDQWQLTLPDTNNSVYYRLRYQE